MMKKLLTSIITLALTAYCTSNTSMAATVNDGNMAAQNDSITDAKVHKMDELDVPPSFPGGENIMNAWINQNVVYPKLAAESGVSGEVTVGFVVMADGSIDDVHIVGRKRKLLDKEAIRVVKSMPQWIPGMIDGHPVNAECSVPINFRLMNW